MAYMAFGCTINILYLLTDLLYSAVSSLMMLWWLTQGCMGQRFASRHCCNAVVWIAELVHVKKSWKLVEISLTTLF